MNQAKEQRHGIVSPHLRGRHRLIHDVVDGHQHNGGWNQKLDEPRGNGQTTQRNQRKRQAVTNSKGGHQNQNSLPLLNSIDRTQRNEKKNMVETREVRYMLETQMKIEKSGLHVRT